MNYIGSKLKLSSFIVDTIKHVVEDDLSEKVLCDIFAGTGIVGRTFKSMVKKVISNDCEYYSYVLNRNYIGNNQQNQRLDKLLAELNSTPNITDGFIYNNYCVGGNGERQYFSDYNGQKIDATRTQLECWSFDNYINDDEYYFLLCSLLESSDKLANTASVYGAYLKQLKKSAQTNLVIEPAYYEPSTNTHEVFQLDANALIKKIEGDILYLDPPYNQRQYGANYHLLNTIAEYKPFAPHGKTGLRPYKKSQYCNKKQVQTAFEELIKEAKFKFIFLSYNNEGLMSVEEVRQIMEHYGHYDLAEKKYQRFKADKTENRNHKADFTFEYLHILEKE